MKTLTHMIFGALIAIVFIAAIPLLGFYNVAANKPHSSFMEWFLHTTMERSVKRQSSTIQVASLENPKLIQNGLQSYQNMCVGCHGAPGVERNFVGDGLNPQPPDLSDSAKEYSAKELFWIIKHGIKMTGMPSFEKGHSDSEVWEVVAFVKSLPELSEYEYQMQVEKLPPMGQGSHGGSHSQSH